MGSVRLLEQLRPHDPPSLLDIANCREWLRAFFAREMGPSLKSLLDDASKSPAVLVGTQFGEDPEYFTMHQCRTGTRRTISSAPLANQRGWEPIPNGTVLALE